VFVPLGETGAMENAMSVVFTAAAMLFDENGTAAARHAAGDRRGGMVPGGWVFSVSALMPQASA
jgi:flagellar biosynthetic protein FlhB